MTLGPSMGTLAPTGWGGEIGLAAEPRPDAPSVAVYHDRALARAGLVALLAENSLDVVAASPVDPERTFAAVAAAADVALVALAGHGAELAHRLGRETETPVLMMLEEPADGDMLLTIAASGASGCVCHECPPERVLRAIRAVAVGATFFECAHQPSGPVVAVPALLSERERGVVAELARGAQTEEIALSLCISPHTVRTHVRNIKRKLDARTCAQAVAMAITLRLVAPPVQNSPAPPPRSLA
jgi:two-component system invasion response regulator UvrY